MRYIRVAINHQNRIGKSVIGYKEITFAISFAELMSVVAFIRTNETQRPLLAIIKFIDRADVVEKRSRESEGIERKKRRYCFGYS